MKTIMLQCLDSKPLPQGVPSDVFVYAIVAIKRIYRPITDIHAYLYS